MNWLIWIFFGLPGLAIWKCDGVVNVITTIGTIVLLPLIEYGWRDLSLVRINVEHNRGIDLWTLEMPVPERLSKD